MKKIIEAAVAAGLSVLLLSCSHEAGRAVLCGPDVSGYVMAPCPLTTRWTSEVNPENPLPEYPRPQMKRREWRSLNGLWEYCVADSSVTECPDSLAGKILVPFAMEAPLSGVGEHLRASQSLWYRRTFTVPKRWRGRRILINFGAVDYAAEVFVNGSPAGRHKGGYTSFAIDATPFLTRGSNTLEVRVLDATCNYQPRGKQASRSYIIWYTGVSGIWQSVWMEPVSKRNFIKAVYPSTEGDSMTLDLACGEPSDEDEVRVEVFEGGVGVDDPVSGSPVADVRGRWPLTFRIPDAERWSPGHPYLYGLRISLIRNGRVIDRVDSYTAFRDLSLVEDAEGHMRLATDGVPVFHLGTLDQGYWPDGIYTAPADSALLYDIVRTKEFGFNMIRKHAKVEPFRWYAHCDREGIMVWQDMPSQSNVDGNIWYIDRYGGTEMDIPDSAMDNFQREWLEVVDGLRFFPCIVTWVPFNESWGQARTEQTVAMTKAADPTRFVDPASGGNHFHCGEIVDFHNYPEPRYFFFEPGYASVIGEYGGIGNPVEGHAWSPDASWSTMKFDCSEDAVRRYEEYAASLAEYAREGVAAAVYTQITDVETEVNGIMTYDREVDKFPAGRVASANRLVIEVLKQTEKDTNTRE